MVDWYKRISTRQRMSFNLVIALLITAVLTWVSTQPPQPKTMYSRTLTAVLRKPSVLNTTLATHTSVHKNKPLHKLQLPPPVQPDFNLPPIVNRVAPLIYRIPTTKPVVFLTIDDGEYKDPSVVQALAQDHIKATLFLAKLFISDNPQFFTQLTAQGSVIEDHSLTHDTDMTSDMTLDQQKAEICGMADYEQQQYGHRPLLFRPPGGADSLTLRTAAAACGMRAVVTWSAKANGGSMQYQVGNELRPGDIVLMHFRPEFLQDLAAFVAAKDAAGLQTQLLENWVLSPSSQ